MGFDPDNYIDEISEIYNAELMESLASPDVAGCSYTGPRESIGGGFIGEHVALRFAFTDKSFLTPTMAIAVAYRTTVMLQEECTDLEVKSVNISVAEVERDTTIIIRTQVINTLWGHSKEEMF